MREHLKQGYYERPVRIRINKHKGEVSHTRRLERTVASTRSEATVVKIEGDRDATRLDSYTPMKGKVYDGSVQLSSLSLAG